MSFIDIVSAPRAHRVDTLGWLRRRKRDGVAEAIEAERDARAAERRRQRAESAAAVFDAYRRFGIR